ncbi:Uncharacterised protein [Providencia stuartii]|nr:Uncharacterised protein [Providencia stuartii]
MFHTPLLLATVNLDNNQVEYKARRNDEKALIGLDNVVSFLKEKLANTVR